MDRVTQAELENLKLTKSLRGYSCAQVDAIVKRVISTLEAVHADNSKLEAENAALARATDLQRSELEMLRRDSRFVQEALITAQKTADEIRLAAQRHADLILEQAKQAALSEQKAAQKKVLDAKYELDRLRQERAQFVEDFKQVLEGHLKDLSSAPTLEIMEGTAS
jgi:cell division initiation protein